jgi:pimeloyl-ACP methyl ester carboxylesterase
MQVTPAPMGIYPLRAKDAVTQLHSAINFISQQTGVSQVSLLGWSWGSIVAAMYSADYPKQVQKLILYGSMYSATLPAPMATMVIQPFQQQAGIFSLKLPAYQNIPWEEVHEHWLSMLQGKTDIVSPEAMDAVAKSYIKIDPNPFIKHTLRRPMGPMEDLFYIWNQKPIYDISRVTVPTLVIYGDQDVFADHHLYSQLNHVKIKKQVVIPEATHWLIYEKGRIPFYKEIINFLKQSN